MKEQEFVALVDGLEGYARENPGAYKLRVGLLAAFGYLFLFGVVGVVLFIALGVVYFGRINFITIKLLIIPLGLAAVVVRSLWIKFPPPEGQELKYDDAPRLFDMAREIRAATNGPKLHKVLLTDDYNAGIIQRPRLGVLGWQENYLIVGLPLLGALSPTDVKAVLAHEFGHLSGNHGKFTGWIYRVRQTWTQIMENLQQQPRHGSFIFERFFDWYAPYFAAYSFVLARTQEYEADRCSVEVAGRENAARALINLELKEKALSEKFWPAFYKRADQQADPPRETFSEMLQTLREPVAPEKAQVWFSQSLTARHSYDDTHPALGDRLEAMGYRDIREVADVKSFATTDDQLRGDQYLLASEPARFIREKNRWWHEQLKPGWNERNKFVGEAEQGLVALEEKAKTTELTLEERWDRARYISGTQGNAAAIPALKEVLALMPDHAAANFTLGDVLLEQGDEAGIQHLELAMGKDPNGTGSCCELIYNFLNSRGRAQDAEVYRQRAIEYYEKVELARRERESISVHDDFKFHGLSREALEALRSQLRNFPGLGSAYLVQKVVKHFPDQPSYVLGVTSSGGWYTMQSNKRDQQLINELAERVTFSGSTYIIALENDFKGLRKVFKNIAGAQIYESA